MKKIFIIMTMLIAFSGAQAQLVLPNTNTGVVENVKKPGPIAEKDIERLKKCVGNSSLVEIVRIKKIKIMSTEFIKESKKIYQAQNVCMDFFQEYVKKYNKFLNKAYYVALERTAQRLELEQRFIQTVVKKYKGENVDTDEIVGLQKGISIYYTQEQLAWAKVELNKDFTGTKEDEKPSMIWRILSYLFTHSYIYIALALFGFLVWEKMRLGKQKKLDNEYDDFMDEE